MVMRWCRIADRRCYAQMLHRAQVPTCRSMTHSAVAVSAMAEEELSCRRLWVTPASQRGQPHRDLLRF